MGIAFWEKRIENSMIGPSFRDWIVAIILLFDHSCYWGISIRNSSLISKVESRKLAGAMDSCLVLFGTLQQCAPTEPGGNRTRHFTVRKPVSNHCATSARSRLEFSASPINDISVKIPIALKYKEHTFLFEKLIIKLYSFIGLHCSTYQMTKVKGQL